MTGPKHTADDTPDAPIDDASDKHAPNDDSPNDDSPNIETLARQVDEDVLLSDRHRFSRSVDQILRRLEKQQPADRSLSKLAADVTKSVAVVEKRRSAAPAATLEESLPISTYADEIKEAIENHQVIIVCGETGSGKSTQLPKICLQLGRGRRGLIGHTQPRRIAARSIASRLSDEMKTPLGGPVGYQVRFQDHTREDTLIKLMTDGILLAETQGDKLLTKYDTLIIDEAHERSLNIDFLLGFIKRILPKRPDLKLIITSATLDAERFAEHFGRVGTGENESTPAPVVNVPGRTFPVEVRYRPVETDDSKPNRQSDWLGAAAAAACDAVRAPTTDGSLGDVLVFLPTERDIRELAETLRGRLNSEIQSNRMEVVPLYGRLSVEAQNKVFQPTKARRIVLATNVAESSLTVPNIRTVVDPGLARISRFAVKSKVQRLPVEAVSKASCNQRAGRCGRVGPGICIRLYSEEDFESREPYTSPEILRTNLASVILQIEALGLGRIDEFPFIEPPRQQAIVAGTKTLFELGAFDADRRLTEIGRQLSRMPVDPRIGRMLLAAHDEGCLSDMLIVAAALEVRDPRDRPPEKRQAADEKHAQFAVEGSDFMTLLSMWSTLHEQQKKLSKSKFRKWLNENFLSYVRTREWQDVHRQLRQLVRELGWKEVRLADGREEKPQQKTNKKGRGNRPPKKAKPTKREDAVHRAVLAGMLSNLGRKGDEGREYVGPAEARFVLWPGSVLSKSKPKWIVSAEQVETELRYARCVGPVAPEWVEPLAKHLVNISQFEPHYSEKADAAMVYERVALWGLIVTPKRRAKLSRHDPAAAHEMFVREALAAGRYESKGGFQQKNRDLFDRIAAWQDKTRRADRLLGEDAAFDFYSERVPADISDGRSFEKWRIEAEQEQPDLLVMQTGDLLAEDELSVDKQEFPDDLDVGPVRYPLRYSHNPGGERDGVTLVLPREAVGQIDHSRLGWLVPGLLEEKVAALLRTLPKEQRRQLVPIPETARELYAGLKFGEGDLLDQLGLLLRRRFGLFCPHESFDVDRLPSHLQMGIAYAHEEQTIGDTSAAPVEPDDDPDLYGGSDFTSWTWGELPVSVTQRRGGFPVVFHPAVIDDRSSVSVRLLSDQNEATRSTMAGLTRLFLIGERERIKKQIQFFPHIDRHRMVAMKFGLEPKFDEQLAWLLASKSVFAKATVPRTEAAWQERLKLAQNQVSVAVQDVAGWLGPMMDGADRVHRALSKEKRPAFQETVEDLSAQLAMLIPSNVLIDSPAGWLPHVERHLRAMLARLGKLEGGGLNRDRQVMRDIVPRFAELQQWWSQSPTGVARPTAITQYRWLFEEYRIMRFVQDIGTVGKISEASMAEARAKAADAMAKLA